MSRFNHVSRLGLRILVDTLAFAVLAWALATILFIGQVAYDAAKASGWL